MVGSSLHRHVGEHSLKKCQGIQLVEEGRVFAHFDGNHLEVCLGPPPVIIVVLFVEAWLAIGALVLGIHFIEIGSEITLANKIPPNESKTQSEYGNNPF